MPIDPLELAWCAGFFDGEGSTVARAETDRGGYRQLNVAVPQSSKGAFPAVLARFQRTFTGLGHVRGPNSDGIYAIRYEARAEAHFVLMCLWPYLGTVKRAQATRAIVLVEEQYDSGKIVQRPPRRPLSVTDWPAAQLPATGEVEQAWAAGFLDAEGCFGLAHSGRRVRGPDWYRLRVSATQHGVVGEIPEVLIRLQRALGGIGRIERHGEPDDYKWVAEGEEMVTRVLGLTAHWLGTVKLTDAATSLEAFRAQLRLKGNQSQCVRGHDYSYVVMRGGRLRRVCLTCQRLLDRRARARQGIAPRPFRDVSRRYTE